MTVSSRGRDISLYLRSCSAAPAVRTEATSSTTLIPSMLNAYSQFAGNGCDWNRLPPFTGLIKCPFTNDVSDYLVHRGRVCGRNCRFIYLKSCSYGIGSAVARLTALWHAMFHEQVLSRTGALAGSPVYCLVQRIVNICQSCGRACVSIFPSIL
jgi:hypothetical protein